MRNRQLVLLFICNCIPPFIGMALFPLLPLYAAQFGATRTAVGLYYAVVYAASLLGTFGIGLIPTRLPRKALFVAAATLGAPAVASLGQVAALWQLVALTALIWLCAAIVLTLNSVFTGLIVDTRNRGKAFTLLFLAYPIGGFGGGTLAGFLVERYGYATMFAVLAAIWGLLPILALAGLRVPLAASSTAADIQGDMPAGHVPRAFYLLMLGTLISALGINIGKLGTSLSMQALGFSPAAVASTATMSGLATIPVAILLGTLADRFGHRPVLRLSYLSGAAGLLMLVAAVRLGQFQLAVTLLTLASAINGSVGAALATTLLPPHALGRYLPRFNAVDSAASIAGFAWAGWLMDTLGDRAVYSLATALVVCALPLLGVLSIRTLLRRPRPAAAPQTRTPALQPLPIADELGY